MSKSLVTLTLDLVAMSGSFTGPLDRARQQAKKRNAEIAKSFESLAMVAARTGLFPSYLDNQGKVGDHTGQFLARLPACITSSTADLWMLLSRTNDSTTAGMTLADSKANVMKIVTVFINTPGKYLIVGPAPHDSAKALPPMARRSASSCVATWQRRAATSTCNPRPTWYRPT